MAFSLPPLPYPENALEPHVSARTMSFHHGKHHKGYVDKLNELTAGKPEEQLPLEEVVRRAAKQKGPLFNNAGQAWNHEFFWQCLTPRGGGAPTGKLAEAVRQSFGSLEDFRKQFRDHAVAQFGSGWVWLVHDGKQLVVTSTPNAETPIAEGKQPLLTCDVWEHAYYLDYQNRRADFVDVFLDKLVSWNFAAENLHRALGEREDLAAE